PRDNLRRHQLAAILGHRGSRLRRGDHTDHSGRPIDRVTNARDLNDQPRRAPLAIRGIYRTVRACRRQVYRLHPWVGPNMTTPAKVSSAAYALQHLRFRAWLLAAGLVLAVPLFGCGLFHSDFDIAVGNRMAN